MPAPLALIGPALKMLATQGVKQAAIQTAKGAAKNAVKNKAKNFVTGKGRKKKGKRGKGGALVKSEGGKEEGSEEGGGGAIVPTTPIVGKYRVETPPQKPDEVGKPSKISYEAINNQLDSIVALTGVLKKTSMSKMKTATNRRKAERKAEEKAKQRDRESLLERGAVGAIGAVGGAVSKAAPFDPLKFFTMILLGSLLLWIVNNGSKITAFLKTTLALMNNFGKLVKAGFTALKNVFKVGFNAIKKLGGPLVKVGKALKNGIKSVGSGLSRAFGRIGNGIKNLAKGVINKIKAAGKILASPLKALQGLTGAEKKAVKTNKGLNKLLQQGGTGSQNLGTATRPPGTLSNATRSMRIKHGDEAARMYQGLIDNGMKPSKAAQYVNKSISSGKLTSAPLEGTLAGGKKGSQLLKGGAGRSTNRVIAKVGGKNALKATKALKKALGRIPIVGGLITLVVSLLGGDPVSQALFKTGGAVLGGFLGSFIPIPVVGTLFGEIVGEYVGDLMYVATMGGGVEAVGQKLKDDLTAALSVGQKAMDWVGNGFGRMYEGIPKINVPFINKKFPDPVWMINPMNLMEKLGIFHKAFFTDKPMEKGKEEEEKQPGVLSNQAQQIQSQQYYYQPGVGYFASGSQQFLGATEQEAKAKLGLTTTSVATTSNAGYWAPLLETIAKKESVGGSYDSIYPSTTKVARYGGKPLTEMTIREADAWQASTYRERGSAAAGRYQFMSILSQATTYSDVKPDDLFNAENQDKMAIGLIVNKRKITPEMIKNNPDEAILRLAQEWAAFPVPRDMQGHNQFVKAGQSYYAGDGRNASGATVAEMRAALNKLGAPQVQSQQPQQSVQPQTPLVNGQKKTAVLAYGTNDWGLSESEIKKRATGMIRDLMSKGYNVVVVPPNKDLNVKGYGKKDAPYRGVYSAAAETGAIIESGKYSTADTLHLEPADAKRIFNKYKSAIYVGDSNAVRMKASMSGDYSNTATAVSGARGDMIQQYIDSAVESVSSRQATPDNSDQIASQDQSDSNISSTPAQVTPPAQSQMSSGINGISRQLPYEEVGGTTILMSPGRSGSTMVGRTSAGTPVIVGSGDVVNSYYKSQLLGFLYKQG